MIFPKVKKKRKREKERVKNGNIPADGRLNETVTA
jgi:hypothetical protein